MSWLPQSTALGRLTITEIFEFYDGPRLFTCESATGQKYLTTWAEEADEHDLWLYVPLSNDRLNIVRSGGMTVRRALLSAEDHVFVVKTPFDEQDGDEVMLITSGSELDMEWLPDEDYSLDLETATAPPASESHELAQKAQREARSILRLEINPSTSKRTAAPTRDVGNLLVLTQNLLDNVGYSIMSDGDDVGERGQIPATSRFETSSEVIGLSAASFVIDVASTRFASIFDSTFEKSTDRIIEVLGTAADSAALTEKIRGLNKRAAKSFRKFVKHLSTLDGPATFVSASQNAQYKQADLSTDEIASLLARLNYLAPDEEQEPITGQFRLFRGDVDNGTFGAEDRATGASFTGYVDEQALPGLVKAPLGNDYEMTIAVTSVTDEMTNDKQFTYRLLQITPPSD